MIYLLFIPLLFYICKKPSLKREDILDRNDVCPIIRVEPTFEHEAMYLPSKLASSAIIVSRTGNDHVPQLIS